jgi:orotate phosphoribosyltransferase
LLALYLNLPLTDVEGLCESKTLYSGRRLSSGGLNLSKGCNVLIVDDSVCSGTQMNEVRERLFKSCLPHRIRYGAVYITPDGCKYVDFWYQIVDVPRVFEWNIMHHDILFNCCVDIDGILNRDPTPQENDDGEKYNEFMVNVKPLIVPTKTIGWLVTCRLEKYRAITEAWLMQYGIRYNNLVMLDLPDKATRVGLGTHAEYKADVYKSTGAALFIESSMDQAHKIARLTGKYVLCTETGEMITPELLLRSFSRGREILDKAVRNPCDTLLKSPRFLRTRLYRLQWRIAATIKKRNSRH